ncbi:MAG: succinate dehydrogenase assembly factor 2 [Alphaproteobacteria bacterium]|nr:succinate dehydrogenase assembly factor 2 [Alphaproteobacteria bacterium]
MDAHRRKLHFRSCHRGMKEMDIIFSRFAEVVLPHLPEKDLPDYERILNLPDDKLFYWAIGRAEAPAEILSPLLSRFLTLDYMRP